MFDPAVFVEVRGLDGARYIGDVGEEVSGIQDGRGNSGLNAAMRAAFARALVEADELGDEHRVIDYFRMPESWTDIYLVWCGPASPMARAIPDSTTWYAVSPSAAERRRGPVSERRRVGSDAGNLVEKLQASGHPWPAGPTRSRRRGSPRTPVASANIVRSERCRRCTSCWRRPPTRLRRRPMSR